MLDKVSNTSLGLEDSLKVLHPQVGEEMGMTRDKMIADQLEFWQRIKEREQKSRPALSAVPHKTFYTKIAHTRH